MPGPRVRVVEPVSAHVGEGRMIVVDAGVDDPGHDPLALVAGEAARRGAVVDPAGADPGRAGVGQELPRLVGLHPLHAG